MKEPITVYTWVKTSESLPIGKVTARKGAFTGELQIRKDGAYFYYENTILDYEFSDPRLYEFEWLKPQELITFTKEEWSEYEKKISRLKELRRLHINPYNLGDMGEISELINNL